MKKSIDDKKRRKLSGVNPLSYFWLLRSIGSFGCSSCPSSSQTTAVGFRVIRALTRVQIRMSEKFLCEWCENRSKWPAWAITPLSGIPSDNARLFRIAWDSGRLCGIRWFVLLSPQSSLRRISIQAVQTSSCPSFRPTVDWPKMRCGTRTISNSWRPRGSGAFRWALLMLHSSRNHP